MGLTPKSAFFYSPELEKINFSGASLDGSVFTPALSSLIRLQDINFSGASLRDASFLDTAFCGDINFSGADLTGTIFTGCLVASETSTVVDVRDTNITSEQLDFLADGVVADRPIPGKILFDSISIQEAAKCMGVSEEELVVSMWASDVPARDINTGKKIFGEFNKDRHCLALCDAEKYLGV